MSNNSSNNNNNKKSKKFASNIARPRTLEDMDTMFDRFSEGLKLATALGYKECAVCKTMSQKDSPCETCGKPRTEYAADVVLTNEEMMQGFDRMCDWADKKKKEGKKNDL